MSKRHPTARAVKRLLKRFVRNKQYARVLAMNREIIHWCTQQRDGYCCLCYAPRGERRAS